MSDNFADSILASIGGLFLILISVPFLLINERHNVKVFSLFKKAQETCEEVENLENPEIEKLGKLVFAQGEAFNREAIFDHDLLLESEPNCLKMEREIKMLQWV